MTRLKARLTSSALVTTLGLAAAIGASFRIG